MNEAVSALLVVQDRDSRIESLSHELKRVPAEKQRISHYGEQRKEGLLKAKKNVQETEMAIKNIELDVETRRTSVLRLKTQQMETRKNDEYQAFGREIERLTSDIDELETQQLGLMEQLDANKAAYKAAEAKYKEVEGTIDGELASLEEKAANLEASLKELQAERQTLIAPVDEELVARYDRMRKTKGLPVVVLLSEAGLCAGCHTKVIRSTEARVREGKEVVECENCGRILH